MIRVLIIEDDFRVANINREYVLKMKGYEVVQMTKTAEETLNYLAETTTLPDLILLDVYIPDDEDFHLFWTLRREYSQSDIIMLTAANEMKTVKEAFHGGVFDYLLKPVDFSRFENTLIRYAERTKLLKTDQTVDQATIDQLNRGSIYSKRLSEKVCPKGIDEMTLQKIIKVLSTCANDGITAFSVGEQVGVSRSTARRYLEYLVSIQEAKAQLKYGEVGRPERRYMP